MRKLTHFVFALLAVAALSVGTVQADWKESLNQMWQDTKEITKHGMDQAKEGWEGLKPKEPVEIGIAYGTEKKKWLQWAVEEFAKTPQAENIKINLIPMGSVEGAEAVLKQDKRINVWTPASGLVRDLLVDKWQREHNADPIDSDAMLALTPMVMVMWKDRHEAFVQKYTDVNFKTIAEALNERTGWAAIANKADWGLFTFGHTQPTHSNSGLLALVLMAYDYHNLFRGVKAQHIMDEGFLTWLEGVQEGMTADETSTGKLMKSMLQRGPSAYNGIIVYENLALSNLGTAASRWGEIEIVYPTRSVWNDNPYYILNVPWSTLEQKNAARLFQQFLLSEKAQKEARDKYLFRPANVDVAILGDGSAFDKVKDIVQIDVPTIRRPKGEVLEQLIQIWKRNQ